MDNAIYIALSKQRVQFRKLDVHANNMANANTPGFKRNDMMITDWIHNNGDGGKVAFAQDIKMYRDTSEGGFTRTNNPMDLAISGEGYFAVETAAGVRYTRSGNFTRDGAGTLIMHDGSPVLNADGARIIFDEEAQNIEFRENGAIVVDGEEFEQLQFVTFPNQQQMTRLGDTLYTTDQQAIPVEEGVGQPRIAQGFVEQSNVQSIREMTALMETSRRVSTTSDFIDRAYELQRRAMGAWSKQGSQ